MADTRYRRGQIPQIDSGSNKRGMDEREKIHQYAEKHFIGHEELAALLTRGDFFKGYLETLWEQMRLEDKEITNQQILTTANRCTVRICEIRDWLLSKFPDQDRPTDLDTHDIHLQYWNRPTDLQKTYASLKLRISKMRNTRFTGLLHHFLGQIVKRTAQLNPFKNELGNAYNVFETYEHEVKQLSKRNPTTSPNKIAEMVAIKLGSTAPPESKYRITDEQWRSLQSSAHQSPPTESQRSTKPRDGYTQSEQRRRPHTHGLRRVNALQMADDSTPDLWDEEILPEDLTASESLRAQIRQDYDPMNDTAMGARIYATTMSSADDDEVICAYCTMGHDHKDCQLCLRNVQQPQWAYRNPDLYKAASAPDLNILAIFRIPDQIAKTILSRMRKHGGLVHVSEADYQSILEQINMRRAEVRERYLQHRKDERDNNAQQYGNQRQSNYPRGGTGGQYQQQQGQYQQQGQPYNQPSRNYNQRGPYNSGPRFPNQRNDYQSGNQPRQDARQPNQQTETNTQGAGQGGN